MLHFQATMPITIAVPETPEQLTLLLERIQSGEELVLAKEGVAIAHIIPLIPKAPAEPLTEADLLRTINVGLPPETWEHYHHLIAKRQAETLTPEEHGQLIEISDRLEMLNVDRVKALIQLATLRNQPLEELMQSLGINPNPNVLESV